MRWENPPAKGKRQSKWTKVATELRNNPDRWARLDTKKGHNAHSLAGRLRDLWGDDYEVKSQMLPDEGDNVAGVWGRYTSG